MIHRTLVSALRDKAGQTVTVCGFAETIRDQRKVQFLIVRDHTGKVQSVHVKTGEDDSLATTISGITPESAISVTGKIVINSDVKMGGMEIEIESIKVYTHASVPLPIAPDSDLELQIDQRQLSLRRPFEQLVFRVQTTLEIGMRRYWEQHGFVEIHSPKLMGTPSESGAELFEVPYFGNQTAYLAQSPQFYKQMAIAGGLERVFEVGPVFRANPSFTSRHDTEFTSVDMELAWVESHTDIMQVEEEWIASALSLVAERHADAITREFGAEVHVPSLPFPQISLAEARKLLARMGHTIDQKCDLDPRGERLLGQYVMEEFGHEFVFVTDYPVDVRPFYHMRHEADTGLTKSFDLLWRGLEITTGAQREHRVAQLERQALEKGISLESLRHYLNFFRYGCPPHGGCGVGLTRMLMTLLGRSSVREVTLLFRGPNRLTP